MIDRKGSEIAFENKHFPEDAEESLPGFNNQL
jgi:hypothetical protein